MPEPHLNILLERGQVFQVIGRERVKGMRHRCHQNAALHYLTHHLYGRGGTLNIATGYGLHDSIWWQHSWLWDGNRVLETNGNHEVYFGVVLNDVEAAVFVVQAAIHIAPGGAPLSA